MIAAFPAVPDLAERGRKDGVGDAYVRMRDRGELRVHPGHTVKLEAFLRDALERFGVPCLLNSTFALGTSAASSVH